MSEERAVTKTESKKKDNDEGNTVALENKKNKEIMAEMFSWSMQSGGLPKEILQKVNEKHIDKVLEISEKANTYPYNDNKSGRRYGFAYAIIGLILIGFLVFTLKDNNKELLVQILVVLASILGGFGAGYGYCKHKSH